MNKTEKFQRTETQESPERTNQRYQTEQLECIQSQIDRIKNSVEDRQSL